MGKIKLLISNNKAYLVEMVDTLDLKSDLIKGTGSSPVVGNNYLRRI